MKNYDIKTYEEVQNLLKNKSLNKKRKILEKAIKQAKHATNVLRGQQTGVKPAIQGWYDHGKDKRREIEFDKRGVDNIDESYQISTTSA